MSADRRVATRRTPASRPAPSPRVRARSFRTRTRWAGLAFVALPLTLYAVVVIWPLLQSVQYSFFHWDGVSTATWAGLENYQAFFTDPVLASSLGHVAVLIVFFSLLPIGLGLVTAAMLTRSRQRGMGLFRWIFFLPQVLTSVVVALMFKRIYALDGSLNALLEAVGLGSVARAWLADFSWALPALGLIGTWVTFGFCMVLFISGTSSISPELYEAARVDGAGAIREFFSITLPGLRGQIGVALTLTITTALRTFDLVWVTTRGGPGTATQTPAVLLYRAAFQNPDVGRAAAIGVVMALVCLLIAMVITRVTEGQD